MMPRRLGGETSENLAELVISRDTRNKIPHIKPLLIGEKMTDGQKLTASNFNKMRDRLLELGEMEN